MGLTALVLCFVLSRPWYLCAAALALAYWSWKKRGSVRGMGQAIRFCGLCACQSQLRTCISVQRCLRDQAVFLVETQTQGLYHNAVPCDWGVWRLLCAYSHGVYFVALSAGCFTLAFQQLLEVVEEEAFTIHHSSHRTVHCRDCSIVHCRTNTCAQFRNQLQRKNQAV